MDRIAAFLAMGGHGGFVWGAYGTAAVVLVALLVASFLRVGARSARWSGHTEPPAWPLRPGRGAP
jgi:heme exporter protein CcmD